MRLETALKLGQIAGAIMMAAGVAGCTLRDEYFTLYFIGGAVIYGGCRLWAWLKHS